MISKTKLKELTAYRQQKRCDEEAVFVVEGPKMASEALLSGAPVRVVCAVSEWMAVYGGKVQGAECYEVSQSELERLSGMKSPSQVWMLVQRGYTAEVPAQRTGLVLALDRIQDPGNMGTMMRTADWFGVRRVVCSADTVDCYNPKVVQASMGAIFRTKVEYVDLPHWLRESGLPVYGASLRGIRLCEVEKPQGAAVLLIGNESRGISDEAMRAVSSPVLIPNLGSTAESLNAAVAAGILMNHFCN